MIVSSNPESEIELCVSSEIRRGVSLEVGVGGAERTSGLSGEKSGMACQLLVSGEGGCGVRGCEDWVMELSDVL